MSALGGYLSGLREERGISIDEMARVTRVASRYLEALEREDFTALPAPVFTKGYIRAYCQALGISVDEALARYAGSAGIAVAPTATVAPLAARTADNGRRARGTLLVSFVLLVGFGLALFVVALFLQSGRPEIGVQRVESVPPTAESRQAPARAASPPAAQPPTQTVPPIAFPPVVSMPPGSGMPSVPSGRPPESTATSAVETPATSDVARREVSRPASDILRVAPDVSRPAVEIVEPPALRLSGVVSPYRLVVRVSEATWLRVRTEDGRATEETIPAGEVREWVSNRPFVLTVGNAGGVSFELNGRKLPPLGGRGAVINRLILPPPEP